MDEPNLLGAHLVKDGDIIIAMPSSGFHSNGYSLVRHIIKKANLDLNFIVTEYGISAGEVFLKPTEIYALDCLALMRGMKDKLHGFSHITGGGITENTLRVIPDGLTAVYDRSTWALPVEMEFMAQMGQLNRPDMERAWNCGIGMSAIVDSGSAELAIKSLAARGMNAWQAGVIQKRETGQTGSILVGDYAKR